MTLHICAKVLLPVVLNTIFKTVPYPLNTATSYDKKICIKGKRIHLFLCIFFILGCQIHVQSTLVISKSKGPSETLRVICTSTYQVCSIEDKTIRTFKFHK